MGHHNQSIAARQIFTWIIIVKKIHCLVIMKSIYVVLTRTGTILSRLSGCTTGDWYTHSSISLDDNLQTMYAFGRRWAYALFPGGFIQESLQHGVMRRFPRCDSAVIQVEVSDEKYHEIAQYIAGMYANRKKYKYDYWGAILAKWQKRARAPKANRFYCSGFVNDLLERFGIVEHDELGRAVRPMGFLQLALNGKGKVIYRGPLCEFNKTLAK